MSYVSNLSVCCVYVTDTPLQIIEEEVELQNKMSGARSDRPGLDAARKFIREGDTLVVWRLDKLGNDPLLKIGYVFLDENFHILVPFIEFKKPQIIAKKQVLVIRKIF